MKNMFSYKEISNYLPIDLKKLRPKGSYEFLIQNRNNNIEPFITGGAIPKEYLNCRKCPSCYSDKCVTVMNKDGFSIVECQNCSLVYVSEIFDKKFYEDTYSSENYASIVEKMGFESHTYRKERFGVERITKLTEFWNNSGSPSFLDVGCSTGFVVHAATEKGWDAKGIDLNTHAIKFGKENHSLSLSSENFFEIDGFFDFIGIYDVLEHVINPSIFLKNACQHLNKNGCIHIYVPNWNSASRYILGADSHFIWPSHHLTYFTPDTLTKMVQSNGFEVLEMETEGLDFFDIDWMKREGVLGDEFEVSERILNILQFLANSGGHGKNLRCVARKI